MFTFATETIAALSRCNLRFGAYGALGAFLIIRAFGAAREGRHDHAREDALIGLLHLALGLL